MLDLINENSPPGFTTFFPLALTTSLAALAATPTVSADFSKPVTINLSGLTAIHATKTLAYQVRVLPQVGPGGAPMPTLPAAVISKQVAVNAGKAKIILTPPRGGMLLVQLQGS